MTGEERYSERLRQVRFGVWFVRSVRSTDPQRLTHLALCRFWPQEMPPLPAPTLNDNDAVLCGLPACSYDPRSGGHAIGWEAEYVPPTRLCRNCERAYDRLTTRLEEPSEVAQ